MNKLEMAMRTHNIWTGGAPGVGRRCGFAYKTAERMAERGIYIEEIVWITTSSGNREIRYVLNINGERSQNLHYVDATKYGNIRMDGPCTVSR